MASTTLRNPFDEPRTSTDTTRRSRYPESIAPSETESTLTLTNDDDGESGNRAPRAHSPSRCSIQSDAPTLHRHQSIATPERTTQQSYRGFASEQAYLDALRSWAEDKKYEQPSQTTLVGYYGQTTMGELASRPPPPGLNLRKKWRERKASKQLEREEKQNGRRATVA